MEINLIDFENEKNLEQINDAVKSINYNLRLNLTFYDIENNYYIIINFLENLKFSSEI